MFKWLKTIFSSDKEETSGSGYTYSVYARGVFFGDYSTKEDAELSIYATFLDIINRDNKKIIPNNNLTTRYKIFRSGFYIKRKCSYCRLHGSGCGQC
jgi:hypothetical protein